MTPQIDKSQNPKVAPSSEGAASTRRKRRKGWKAVFDLSEDGLRYCAYPHGDPKTPDFFFCAGPVVPGKSYCAACLPRVSVPLAVWKKTHQKGNTHD